MNHINKLEIFNFKPEEDDKQEFDLKFFLNNFFK